MKRTLTLAAVVCLVALAADDAAIAPQAATNLQSTVVGRRSPVIGGPEVITIPQMLSYQGKLTDTLGVPVEDTLYAIRFRLYAQPSGGTEFWEENQQVRTEAGLFSVLLGSVTPIGSMPDAGALYLGMVVEGGAELAPRLRIASAAYTYLSARAANADLLQGKDTTGLDVRYVNEGQADAVTGAMIVNGAVLTADVGDTAVTMAKIAQAGATTGQVVKWTGSAWAPGPDNTGGGSGVTNVYQDTGIICVPNPITSSGNVKLDLSYGDGRYVNEGQANSVTAGMIADTNVTMAKMARAGATSSQVIKWTGSAWAPRNDSAGGGDNAWVRGTPDSVLFTIRRLGIARGEAGNMLYGTFRQSHVNLGVSCTTGVSGSDLAYLTVAGGYGNRVRAGNTTIGGGISNTAGGIASVVAGGTGNLAGDTVSDTCATVAGGYGNLATAKYAFVGGGLNDTASGTHAFVGGGYRNVATHGYATVGGGQYNQAGASSATVAGGTYNRSVGGNATVGGGSQNYASGSHATVGGGDENVATASDATVGGGHQNEAGAGYSTVGGGFNNHATGVYATVAGGYLNSASGMHATVAGGYANNVSGTAAMVPGGFDCDASGNSSFAAGSYAKARGDGSFVWSDSCGAADSVRTATDNRWVARARGGVYFYTNLGMTTGSYLSSGGSSWNSVSDSMTKENFRPLDKKALLDALAKMRVRDYNLKSQDASIRHIGPVAQDFYSAFGFGESNMAINMEDADGVALAAIQALYEQNQALSRRVAELEAKLSEE